MSRSRLVGARNARVHVQHVGAGLYLGDRIGAGDLEIARGESGQHLLAARRIDSFADDDSRACPD